MFERSLKHSKIQKLLITLLLMLVCTIVALDFHKTKAKAQTDEWKIHLNNPLDAPAYWYFDGYDPYNYLGGSKIILPVKTISINDSTDPTLLYTFDPWESGFASAGAEAPYNSYQQIAEITNNSSSIVVLTYNGGMISGTIAPFLEQWISGATTLDPSQKSPYGNSASELQKAAPSFFSSGITLNPGESTPKFGAAFGMPGSTSNDAMGTTGSISWSWHVEKQLSEVSTVTVHYLEQDGRILKPESKLTGKLGEKYESSAPEIPGYQIVEDKLPSNASGYYESGNIDVTYIYDQIDTLTTHYVDLAGINLHDPTVITGEDGENYTASPLTISGYALCEDKLPKNSAGIYCDGNIDVTYVYEKQRVTEIKDDPIQNDPIQNDGDKSSPKPSDENKPAPKPSEVINSTPKPTIGSNASSSVKILPKTKDRTADHFLSGIGLSLLGIAVLLKKRL
ncbi:MAG: MucBP domain-containing protein [Streptococcaceae bacterium]|jgi:hypothetical protein|nr:MucBP domain-containing protein [Streptococcaceae bacterium]